MYDMGQWKNITEQNIMHSSDKSQTNYPQILSWLPPKVLQEEFYVKSKDSVFHSQAL